MPPKTPAGPKKDTLHEHTDFAAEIYVLLLFLIFIGILLARLQSFLSAYGASFTSIWDALKAFFLYEVWPIVIVLAIIIVILCIIGIYNNYRHLVEIANEEKQIYSPTIEKEGSEAAPVMKNERWERVIEHINSANSADWRLAIIEADVILDDLLKAAGYHGESLGERLRAVEKSDMLTLDDAWEAHKIRNQIAHEGAGFQLTERDAKRAIALYESVFREFKVI